MVRAALARGEALAAAALGRGLAPSHPIGAACLAAFAGEIALLAGHGAAVLRHERLLAVWAVLVLAWFWLTAGWAIHLASRLVRGRWLLRAGAFLLLALAGAGLALLEVLSWGMFHDIGLFSSFDMVRLVEPMLSNADAKMLALIAVEARRVAGLLLAIAVGVPLFLALAARRPSVAPVSVAARTWLRATLGVSVLTVAVAAAPGPINMRWEVVRRGMNPALSFLFTGLERLDGDAARSTLDTATLVERVPPRIPPPRERRSVLIIKVESMRADVLDSDVAGVAVTPNIRKLAASAACFTRAYGPATHSDYADTSIHTSHYAALAKGHTDYGANPRWPRTTITSVFKELGYETGFFASGDLSWCDMDVVLGQGVDEFRDLRNLPGALPKVKGILGIVDDAETTRAAIQWIEARKGPFMATLDLQSAHFPYIIPADAPRPFQPASDDLASHSFMHYPLAEKERALNAYRNALHYSDAQIGRVIEALARSGRLDDTIVAVWSDHGEMFHDVEGYVTHSRDPFEPAARVPLVIRAPGLVPPGRDGDAVEMIDLAPTICGRLGLPRHPSFQGVDLFSPERPPRGERLVFVTCDMVVNMDAIIVSGRWKLIRDRDSGRERFFDLEADPGETKSLAAVDSPELRSARAELLSWRDAQNTYYRYPSYYERYWPPRFGHSAKRAVAGQ